MAVKRIPVEHGIEKIPRSIW